MATAKLWLLSAALASAFSDEQGLLGLRYNLLEEFEAGGPQAALAFVQNLSSLAVHEGLAVDNITKDALSMIRQLLARTKATLEESHDADQKLLDQHAEKVKQCRQREKQDMTEEELDSHELFDLQQAHVDCRDELRQLEVTQNETCAKLEEHMQKARENPPTCETPQEYQDVDSYYKDILTYARTQLAVWKGLEAECKASQEVFAAKDAQCDRAQSAFEGSYCNWRFEIIATCSMYFSCMTRASELFEAMKAAMLENAENRKLDFKAIGKIDCNVDVLLLPGDTAHDERLGAYDACQTLDPDAAHLELEAPDLSHLKRCDLSMVQEYPCTELFHVHNHYHEMPSVAECRPCNPLPNRLQEAVRGLELQEEL